MKSTAHHWLILAYFLLVAYPTIKLMTRLMGRAWMFRWRHQLFHRCGSQ